MNEVIKSPIRHMLQGLAHWMAYRNEMSNIQLIEADAVFVATDILRGRLPNDYIVEREVTKKSLPIVKNHRIDMGIKSRTDGSYKCLIELKLADATNKGYEGDVKKLYEIKQIDNNLVCLVIILYRIPCEYNEPQKFVKNIDGTAKLGKIKLVNNIYVKVRKVSNSFISGNRPKSMKTICIEVI